MGILGLTSFAFVMTGSYPRSRIMSPMRFAILAVCPSFVPYTIKTLDILCSAMIFRALVKLVKCKTVSL